MIGPECDVTDAANPAAAARLELPQPLLTRSECAALLAVSSAPALGWTAARVDCTWAVADGAAGMQPALRAACDAAAAAVDKGAAFVVLSDAAASPERCALPPLLVTGAVHHHLVSLMRRTRAAIVVESAEPREVHHFCALLGYGADAVCPTLALDALAALAPSAGSTAEKLTKGFFVGVNAGLLKTMAKMGISTLASYKGAQIFEAVGLDAPIVEAAFAGTPSRVGGVGFADLAGDALALHAAGHSPRAGGVTGGALDNPGEYSYRIAPPGVATEAHLNHPAAIADLQTAARTNSTDAYRAFADRTNALNAEITLRGLLRFKGGAAPIPLDAVESAAEIVKRFVTGAMSYGSISLEAHTTLAMAMNRIGGKSNTGEGGENERRLVPAPDGAPNATRSAIKQVASGRFGVTAAYLTNADEIQIKIAQGAKPGEGGELPAGKVQGDIAVTRRATPGVGLISPPPHHGKNGESERWKEREGGGEEGRARAATALPLRPPPSLLSPFRHLLDRGPRTTHLRPQIRQPGRPRLGQARV